LAIANWRALETWTLPGPVGQNLPNVQLVGLAWRPVTGEVEADTGPEDKAPAGLCGDLIDGLAAVEAVPSVIAVAVLAGADVGRVPIGVQRGRLHGMRIAAMDDGPGAVLVLDLEKAVRGLPLRSADVSQGAHVPVRFLHGCGSDRVFVDAPFTRGPLDDLSGCAGEIASDSGSLVAPESPIILDGPVVRWKHDRVVRLIVIRPRFPRIGSYGRRAVGIRARQVGGMRRFRPEVAGLRLWSRCISSGRRSVSAAATEQRRQHCNGARTGKRSAQATDGPARNPTSRLCEKHITRLREADDATPRICQSGAKARFRKDNRNDCRLSGFS